MSSGRCFFQFGSAAIAAMILFVAPAVGMQAGQLEREGTPSGGDETSRQPAAQSQTHPEHGDSITPKVNDFVAAEPQMVDFGHLDRGEKRTATIRLTNTSASPVRFVRAFATCGCTVPNISSDSIDPGESIDVSVEFHAKNTGPQGSMVRLFLADRKGDVQVYVRAVVREPVIVKPEIYDPNKNEDVVITLESTDGSPFQILAADPDVLTGIDEERRMKHEVVLSAAKLAQFKNRDHMVRIYIDHRRTDSVLLKSTRIEVSAQTRRLIAWARGDGELGDLAKILEEGADLFELDARGMTPLMYAALAGKADRVRALLDFRADVNAARVDVGMTALMSAAGSPESNSETVQVLLDAGADVGVQDRFGRTALFWAARGGDAERIRLLLRAGADVRVRGPNGDTVLINAVRSGNVENVRAIVEGGAEVGAKDAHGRTALDHAKLTASYQRGQEAAEAVRAIIEYLEQAGG